MVLIGNRHWSGGRDSTTLLGRYLVRTLSLVVILLGVNYVFAHNELLSNWGRTDLTEGNISSLSSETKKLLRELKPEHTIKVEAFISGQVPELYAKTKADLTSMLKEFRATAGKHISVRMHILDPGSQIDLGSLAEKRYGIKPERVITRTRGAIKDENIYLGVAFTCGLQKVVVPMFQYGIPVEYELIRSICTVAKNDRKTLGIVRTDAQLLGGFTFAGGQPQNIPKQMIVEELEKQYTVKEVDPSQPIDKDAYDVMLVAQPSSLGPEELDNVIEAIKGGVPTAVFEDPRPLAFPAPATGEPKMPPGGMFGGGGGPQPKGDIQKLWTALGLEVPGETPDMPMMGGMGGGFAPDIVWQEYNPYPKWQVRGLSDAWVFCRREAPGGQDSISDESRITSGLREILFLVPGAIKPDKNSDLKFTKLVTTGERAGTVSFKTFMDNRDPELLRLELGNPKGIQVLAARITATAENNTASDSGTAAQPSNEGQAEASKEAAKPETKDTAKPEAKEPAKPETKQAATPEAKDAAKTPADGNKEPAKTEPEKKPRGLDVVYVADMDLMMRDFLHIRATPGEDEEDRIDFQFENVNFLLNIIDVLSGDDDYIDIRKRKPKHSTLQIVEVGTLAARENESAERRKFQQKFDAEVDEMEKKNQEEVAKVRKRLEALQEKRRQAGEKGISLLDIVKEQQELNFVQERLNRQLEVKREQLTRQRDEQIDDIRRKADLEIVGIKNLYKFLAVALPPIPPLLVGLVVFVRRRLREREGVAKSRMR
jgi:ABC-2 type transport system permease protein